MHDQLLYVDPQKPRGRYRRYDSKADLTDPSRFEFIPTLDDDVQLYTAIVGPMSLKRLFHLAYLLKEESGKRR